MPITHVQPNWVHTLNMRETFGENWEGPAAHSENAPSATYRTSADLEPYWDGDLLPIIEDANFESTAHFQVLGVCGAEHIHVDGRNCGVVTLLTNELGCGLWSYHMEA